MRITKQPSGGRGEYEIAENAPNGLKPTELLNHQIQLILGTQLLDTGVWLVTQGGKRRLRRINTSYPQVQLQVTNALMLPPPVRDETKMAGGEPVILTDSYILKNINFGAVSVTLTPMLPKPGTFKAEVRSVDCANQAHDAEQIKVPERMSVVARLWRERDKMPLEISSLLAKHEQYIKSQQPIPNEVTKLVRDLQEKVLLYSGDLGIVYSPGTDVVPALLAALNEVIDDIPVSLEQIEPEQLELRRREVQKWRQYVSRRGAESVKFKREVRAAYGYRCVVCGSKFPPTEINTNPGVDAAHILPWATYDLDKVYNGLTLCKLHHWAFDEHLIAVTYRNGEYYVEIPTEVLNSPSAKALSLDILKAHVGKIPLDRLPTSPADRPRPDILQRLNDETV